MVKNNTKKGFISDTTAFDNYAKGWHAGLSKFWLLLGVVLIITLIEAGTRFTVRIMPYVFMELHQILSVIFPALFGLLMGFLIITPIKIGADWIFLKSARKEKSCIEDMFAVFKRNYWNAVLANLLASVFVILGFICFIVPGIIIAIKLAFLNYLIIDRKMKAWDAIKTSWSMTNGHSWTIFGMFLIAIPLVIIGLICLIIGIFPVAVWVGSSSAVLYHSVAIKK